MGVNKAMLTRERKIFLAAAILSIMLHILLLLLELDWLKASSIQPKFEPIVLELEQPTPKAAKKPTPVPPQPQQQNPPRIDHIPFAEPETPSEVQPESGALAETNALSAAPDPSKVGGNDPVPDAKRSVDPQAGKFVDKSQQLRNSDAGATIIAPGKAPEFSKNFLSGDVNSTKSGRTVVKQPGDLKYVQEKSQAAQLGNFQLSTINWNFVPWLEAFKSKLYHVWYAPAAYHMGLIKGYTVIKFRVSRSGELLNSEVLHHVGHATLEESSRNAIESSFPMRKLPDHFPEKYLEVTGTLIYPGRP